jgi:hypothetical protein
MNEVIINGLIESLDLNKLLSSLKDGKVTAQEVKDCVDAERLAKLIVDELLEKALDKVVESTENSWDNAAKAMLFPLVAPELKKLIAGLEDKI